MSAIVRNGFCTKHNELIVCCYECLDAWQREENKRWINKQRAIKEAYQNIDAMNNYTAMCGDPIESESFH